MEDLAKKRVKDVMREVKTVPQDATLAELVKVFKDNDLSCLPVVDKKGKIIGDVHERDLLKVLIGYSHISERDIVSMFGSRIDKGYFAEKVSDIMNTHNWEIDEDRNIAETAALMMREGIRGVLVKNKKGKVVGILTVEDLIEKVIPRLK